MTTTKLRWALALIEGIEHETITQGNVNVKIYMVEQKFSQTIILYLEKGEASAILLV